VPEPAPADWLRIAELVTTYRDLPLGTVDAAIVAVSERLGIEHHRHSRSEALLGRPAGPRPCLRSPTVIVDQERRRVPAGSATSSVAVQSLVLEGVDCVVPGGPARIVGTYSSS
jgi:hypothetical protein